jgi:hypothetical protein
VGAASSRDHLISRLEAAPTTNTTCSFQISANYNFKSAIISTECGLSFINFFKKLMKTKNILIILFILSDLALIK